MENLTVQEYINTSNKQSVVAFYKQSVVVFLRRAINYAIDNNFDIYMKYDQSDVCGSIPLNMLRNAIIDLTHKRYIPSKLTIENNTPTFYRGYYTRNVWFPTLTMMKDYLTDILDDIIIYSNMKHPAYQENDLKLIDAIYHATWIRQFNSKYIRKMPSKL
jgi:hypothetical protein